MNIVLCCFIPDCINSLILLLILILELIRDKSCYLAIQGRDVHVNCVANNDVTQSRENVSFLKDYSRIDIELAESNKLVNSKESYSRKLRNSSSLER